MRLSKKYLLLFMFLTLFIVSGCHSRVPYNYYINPDIDLSFFKRVAVMPLDNMTNDKYAGEVVRNVLVNELLASGLVEVVMPGEVMAAVNELDIQNISSLNARQINALGKVLNVEAVIMGSVEKYGEIRSGNVSAPEVAISLMMADIGTGNVIWSVNINAGGAEFMARHFGARSKTMSETVITVVREAISTLAEF